MSTLRHPPVPLDRLLTLLRQQQKKGEPTHAVLPPSSAFRWSVCTASVPFVVLNDAALPPSGGAEADEGTRAHALLTYYLNPIAAAARPDDAEMEALMQSAAAYLRRFVQPGDQLLVDQKVPLFYYPNQRGTLDAAIVGAKRGVFYDLKYGKGVSVYAEQNKQLATYAESQIRVLEQIEEWPDSTPLLLVIDQPRDRNDSTRYRSWSLTRGQLRRFCDEEIRPGADTIITGQETVFVPGDTCKFCRAVGICKAYATQGLSVISDEPVDRVISQDRMLQLTSPDSLSREQRQKILAAKDTLVAWLNAIEDQEVHDLLSGKPALQHKLVEGKSNRIWSNPESATSILEKYIKHDQIMPVVPPELVSPAQAEKLLTGIKMSETDKNAFYACISKPKGKPTLAPIDDKRPAYVQNKLEGLTVIDDASLI